eukprot:469948_1
MAFLALLILATLPSLSLSNPKCKYFTSFQGGPLIPMDVCKHAKFPIGRYSNGTDIVMYGSYQYSCLLGTAMLEWHEYSHSCNSDSLTNIWGLENVNANCPLTGGVCDHLSYRSYAGFEANGKTNVCEEQNNEYYIDGAFVTGCWNSVYINGFSAKLECASHESFTLTGYNDLNCNNKYSGQTIEAGCDWFNHTQIIPINHFNLTYETNHTYFKITECGGATNWLWLWLTIIGVCIVCCCGCVGFFCWLGRCRKTNNNKGPINSVYVKTYGYEEGV